MGLPGLRFAPSRFLIPRKQAGRAGASLKGYGSAPSSPCSAFGLCVSPGGPLTLSPPLGVPLCPGGFLSEREASQLPSGGVVRAQAEGRATVPLMAVYGPKRPHPTAPGQGQRAKPACPLSGLGPRQ